MKTEEEAKPSEPASNKDILDEAVLMDNEYNSHDKESRESSMDEVLFPGKLYLKACLN